MHDTSRASCARWPWAITLACSAWASCDSAAAYNLFPFPLNGGTGYSKWGAPQAGTTGGVVTWSLMPPGTPLAPTAPGYLHGTSDLSAVFAKVGGEAIALEKLQAVFDHWSNLANIEFQFVGVDDGSPFAAPYVGNQVIGDVRVGAFEIDGFSAAVGFAPAPNGGTTLEGDILFNSRSDISFYIAPEVEGELYDLFPPGGGFYRNEFQGLAAHEIGHALGLAHTDMPHALMCGFVAESPGFDGSACAYFDPDQDGRAPVNRLADADDRAAIQFLYGAPSRGDFNHDLSVDGSDLLLWQTQFGTTSSDPTPLAASDGNADARVDADDYALWEAQFGTSTAPLVAMVPEPHASALAFVMLVALGFAYGSHAPAQSKALRAAVRAATRSADGTSPARPPATGPIDCPKRGAKLYC